MRWLMLISLSTLIKLIKSVNILFSYLTFLYQHFWYKNQSHKQFTCQCSQHFRAKTFVLAKQFPSVSHRQFDRFDSPHRWDSAERMGLLVHGSDLRQTIFQQYFRALQIQIDSPRDSIFPTMFWGKKIVPGTQIDRIQPEQKECIKSDTHQRQ